MAKARKCDRCGMCFDPMEQREEMVRFQNPIFQNAQSIKETRVLRRLLDDSPETYVDLCPTCTWLFERFMKNEYEPCVEYEDS